MRRQVRDQIAQWLKAYPALGPYDYLFIGRVSDVLISTCRAYICAYLATASQQNASTVARYAIQFRKDKSTRSLARVLQLVEAICVGSIKGLRFDGFAMMCGTAYLRIFILLLIV
jgi:hypothetical protein